MKVSKFEEESKRYRSRFDGLAAVLTIAFSLPVFMVLNRTVYGIWIKT